MPSIYTHELFGKTVLEKLPYHYKNTLSRHMKSFQIGLQGPDILFFHQPYLFNRVNLTGMHMHSDSMMRFLRPAVSVVYQYGKASPQYSYFCGFLLHYLLDSACHPYINKSVKELSFNHIEMEMEFDRYLLEKRGFNAFHYPFHKLVPTDIFTALSMAPFYVVYSGITTLTLSRACKDMRFYKKLLFAPTEGKRKRLERLLKYTGTYGLFQGHLLHTKINKKSEITNPVIFSLVKEEIPEAVDLLIKIDGYFDLPEKEGTEKILSLIRFHQNFKGEPDKKRPAD